MIEEIYTPEVVEEVIGTIHNAEDCVKFVFSCLSSARNVEDAVPLTDELGEAYFDLRNACLEFVNTFDYYNYVHATPFSEEDYLTDIANRTKEYTSIKEENFEKVLKYE